MDDWIEEVDLHIIISERRKVKSSDIYVNSKYLEVCARLSRNLDGYTNGHG
jgi:hypothetical protein